MKKRHLLGVPETDVVPIYAQPSREGRVMDLNRNGGALKLTRHAHRGHVLQGKHKFPERERIPVQGQPGGKKGERLKRCKRGVHGVEGQVKLIKLIGGGSPQIISPPSDHALYALFHFINTRT